jgi:hypothetical protein
LFYAIRKKRFTICITDVRHHPQHGQVLWIAPFNPHCAGAIEEKRNSLVIGATNNFAVVSFHPNNGLRVEKKTKQVGSVAFCCNLLHVLFDIFIL